MSNLKQRVKRLETMHTPDGAPLVIPVYPGETDEQATAIATGGKLVGPGRLIVYLTRYTARRNPR